MCYFFEEKNPSSTLRSKEATPFPHSVTSLKKKGFTLGGVQTCPATSFTAGKTKTHLFLQTQAAGAAASVGRYRFHISASLAANRRIPLRQTPPLASARPPSQALWDGLRPRSWRCLFFPPLLLLSQFLSLMISSFLASNPLSSFPSRSRGVAKASCWTRRSDLVSQPCSSHTTLVVLRWLQASTPSLARTFAL